MIKSTLSYVAFLIGWVGLVAVGIPQDRTNRGSQTGSEMLRTLSSLHSQRAANQGAGARDGNGLGPAGGASIANFSELMRLIESVVDAPWANNGGTSTMFPFRQGVRIDAQGLIERLDETVQPDAPALRVEFDGSSRSQPIVRLDDLGVWQQPSPLRWISLHTLDAQVADCVKQGKSANIAMELLGGLCRIDYVAFDPSQGEWLIGGPAGNIAANAHGDLLHRELRLPPLLLEDLLTIAPQVLNGKGEFGCSIDPDQDRLVAAYKMARSTTSLRELRSDPDHWAHEWKSKLGRQRAMVIGIPEDSPTGYALLLADSHMKRVALGLEPSVDGLENYWLEADSISQNGKGPMVRWWFTLSDSRIPWDPERKIAHMLESNVRVLSESQMLDDRGSRVATERPDWAADAFAKGFTAKFPSLQRTYPVYGRLRHIFDLAVSLEIVRAQMSAGYGKPFQCLHRFETQPHLPVAPKEIESVVATRRSGNGDVAVIVSGGVSIAPRKTADRIRKAPRAFNGLILEASPGDRNDNAPNRDAAEEPFWR
jgi:hypothetical protein